MLELKTGTFLGDNEYSHDADGVVVSVTEYRRRVFEGWHSHANHHVTLILRGGNRERRKNREFAAVPGALLYYRRGELHRNGGTLHPSKNINLEIKDSFLSQYQSGVPALDASPQHSAAAKSSLLKIYKECKAADGQTTASVHALVLMLLSSPLEERASGRVPPWVKRLREIINDRWDEVLSLAELSRLLRVHPVTISKCFPRYFSCTLGEYSRRVKVEKAVTLIGRSSRPLADIAYQCGFADQSHFTRAFKAVTGFLPNEFRKF